MARIQTASKEELISFILRQNIPLDVIKRCLDTSAALDGTRQRETLPAIVPAMSPKRSPAKKQSPKRSPASIDKCAEKKQLFDPIKKKCIGNTKKNRTEAHIVAHYMAENKTMPDPLPRGRAAAKQKAAADDDELMAYAMSARRSTGKRPLQRMRR